MFFYHTFLNKYIYIKIIYYKKIKNKIIRTLLENGKMIPIKQWRMKIKPTIN